MPITEEEVGHADLVGGGETTLHSHAGGGGADLKPWCAIDSTGGTRIGTTATQILLNSVVVSNAGYSLASNEITVNQNGIYEISYEIVYELGGTGGGTRGTVEGHMTLDGTPINQSYSRAYHREASDGASVGTSFIVSINNGQKLRYYGIVVYSNTQEDTLPNKSHVSILKVG